MVIAPCYRAFILFALTSKHVTNTADDCRPATGVTRTLRTVYFSTTVGQKLSLHGIQFLEHTMTGDFAAKPLSALSRILCGHKFKHDSEVRAIVTRWLTIKDTIYINREYKSSSKCIIKASILQGTTCKSSGIAVQLNT